MREQYNDIPALPSPWTTNLGGIRRLWLIDAAQISIKAPSRLVGVITTGSGLILPQTAVVLADTVVIHVWQFLAGWCSFSETGQSSPQGESYKQQLQLTFPKDTPQTTLAVSRMVNRRWICIYQDANGYLKLVGTERQPLSFTSSLSVSGANARQFTFTGESPVPACFLKKLPWDLGPDFLALDFLPSDFDTN